MAVNCFNKNIESQPKNKNPACKTSAGAGTRRTGSGNHVPAAKGGDTMFPVPGYVGIRQSCNGVRTGSESQTGTSLPLPGIELGQPRIRTSSTPSSTVKNPPHSLSPNSEKTSPKDWTKPRRIFWMEWKNQNHAFKAMVPAARHGLWMGSPHATIFQATAEAVAFLLNYSCYP